MKPLEYDLKIIKIIKGIREPALMKQINLAKALNIDQSTYCRIEKGELAITPGQLKTIANALKTNHFQILTCADAFDNSESSATSFSEMLIKFILMIEGRDPVITYTNDEMEFIISKIREKYTEIKGKKNTISNKTVVF